MFNGRFSLLCCVVGILCICLCGGSSHIKKCVETDRQALRKLKDGFIDEMDILSSWKGEDCCKWKGISCDNSTGHVTNLNLFDSLLGGKLDSSIYDLQHLTSLNLSDNYLKGKIPECIGSLGQLTRLELAANELVSVVPPTLGNLSDLQTLDLGFNDNLVVNDLDWLSHLSNLRYLDLSFLNLSQAVDWLSSISKVPSIIKLCLSSCGLRQVKPKSITHLNFSTSLKILNLSRNNLKFSTLSWVLNVSKVLTHLDLSYNSLRSIPNDLANMISLQYLDLSMNELEGNIPKSFQSLCQLKDLRLYSNKLSGQLSDCIPQLCGAQNSLETLVLGNNSFSSGLLPDFSWLSSLKTLSLWNSNIVGPLTQLSSHLPNLTNLDLSNNSFSRGPLPDFSWLSSLQTLSFKNTNIVGSLPQSFGHLPYLVSLDLSFNQLSGSLPLFDVRKLPSLAVLDLSHNQLNGTLPYSIGQFSNLLTLFLSSNKFNGIINEVHLSNLSRLFVLDVAENSLSFNLSSNWVPPFQLTILRASSCILGPKFPTWLKHLRGLEMLEISNSGISDSFPKWFWNLSSSLLHLNVSHNKLTGALPKSFPNMETNQNVWDFSFNHLSGPIPPFPEIAVLLLSNNNLSGSLSSFCPSSPLSLTFLDLSNNLLVGPPSDCWGKFQSLRVLNLAHNNLSGTIPKSFGTLRQLESMHLNNNNFFGEIPSLNLCSSLTLIDFGDNNLQGTIPTWIGHHLHQLIVLHLRANKLQGNIPASLCKLLFLQVLDLSKNNITGGIPQCLNHVIALSNVKFPRKFFSYDPNLFFYGGDIIGLFNDEAILVWKGEYREYGKNLRLMTIIDLSSNHLTGEIPQSITKLVALVSLNLSGNSLTGFIPNNIGHMKMLESLDLSRNHLCGKMPASFSNLTFLSYMDLSFNNLSGIIPQSTQLQSFDASKYEGNNGLCGPPLTNHCPGDAILPSGSPNKHVVTEDEDELITFGFYVSLGLGFFIGFWGVCGALVIKSSWRHAYFQFFKSMNDWLYVTLVVFMNRMKRRFQVQD